MNAHKSVTMEMELGSTRALACSDRRPRRSVEDVVPSLTRIFHAHFDANVRSACSAGFQACCVADFQVGRMSDAAGRQRVWKRYMNAHKTSVTMEMELGSTRALACSDRRPRRSVEDVVAPLDGRLYQRFSVVGGAPTTARGGACDPHYLS